MRIERLLLAAVGALLLLASWIAWGLPTSTGPSPHPRFAGMSQGGSGMERHGDLLVFGWAFGALTITIFVLLIAFGGRRRNRVGTLRGPLIAGFVAFLGAFTWMMKAYSDSLVEAPSVDSLILGFPPASAILIYVLYPVSMIFNLYYVVGYRNWVLSEEDEAAYRELARRRRARIDARTEEGAS